MYKLLRSSFILCLSVLLAASEALAQDGAKLRSDELFHEGIREWEAGNVAGACDLLEQSYELRPRTGTLLNLGDCHKHLGQLVRARRELREARERALRDGQTDRVGIAENALRSIDAELGWLHVEVTTVLGASIELRLDGASVKVDDERPFAVMPGEHTLRLEAEGYKARELSVQVGRGERRDLVFQPLHREPAPLASTQPVPENRDGLRAWRTAALVIGIAGIAAGVGFGAWALERKLWLEENCRDRKCDPDEDLAARTTGSTVATISTIAFSVGAVGWSAWLLLPGGSLNPRAAPEARAGLTLYGTF